MQHFHQTLSQCFSIPIRYDAVLMDYIHLGLKLLMLVWFSVGKSSPKQIGADVLIKFHV